LSTPAGCPKRGPRVTRWTASRALYPQEALTYFRSLLPGEVGIRNELRGDGFFTIDTSLSKGFAMPFGHRLRFRWDVFNVTNTPKFNVGGPVQAGAPLAVTMLPDRTGFGRYNSTLAACDGQAGPLHAVRAALRVLAAAL
jgi:hypothetical protein